ncbi:hypothetical protein C4K68_19345 [Pokkaliibacter plantistimulans]|uniref:CobQ/CobB/MinD/ParA nucleotide binding domain-containing protein n=1 Tax=Proteobacteria bacterium 228 TaxID=2083153 RepID=A0A2S5KLZ0_9PROT|nr:ParA family protein [Pokkaliibacter plantistimulans]PPC75665.1 hypothetical protein C4K68_19345 [Pokkaliibacter plantistimulans]
MIIGFATGGKGGVGKSTIACNMAGMLAHKGFTVALVDCDGLRNEQGFLSEGTQSTQSWMARRSLYREHLEKSLLADGHHQEKVDEEVQKQLPYIFFCSYRQNENSTKHLIDLNQKYDYVIVDTPGSSSEALKSVCGACLKRRGAGVILLPNNMSAIEYEPAINLFRMIHNMESMLANMGMDYTPVDVILFRNRINASWKKVNKDNNTAMLDWYTHVAASYASLSSVSITTRVDLAQTMDTGLCVHDTGEPSRAVLELLFSEVTGKRPLEMTRVDHGGVEG